MTEAAPPRETASLFIVRGAMDVCHLVDGFPVEMTGELVVTQGEDRVRGAIFIERGRVCWAAAHGLAPRLTELLIAQSGVDTTTMQRLYRECRKDGLPLGEQLVARGIVSAEQLRGALAQHTIESIDALCVDEATAHFRPRAGGYNPHFTLNTSEILTKLCARKNAVASTDGDARLQVFSSGSAEEWGALFLRDRSAAFPLPVAMRGNPPDRAVALLRYGQWAASTLDVASAVSDSDVFVSTKQANGTFFVAWHVEGAFVAGCMHAQGPARVLHHRAERWRALSTLDS